MKVNNIINTLFLKAVSVVPDEPPPSYFALAGNRALQFLSFNRCIVDVNALIVSINPTKHISLLGQAGTIKSVGVPTKHISLNFDLFTVDMVTSF